MTKTGAAIHLFVDEPSRAGGAVARQVQGDLPIIGWAFAEDGITAVQVELDGAIVGSARHGIRRPDVAHAFPDHSAALMSGFRFILGQRLLAKGPHFVRVGAVSALGEEQSIAFDLDVAHDQAMAGLSPLRTSITAVERRLAERMITGLVRPPIFDAWLDCTDASTVVIDMTLRSLERQIYRDWRVRLLGAKDAETECLAGRDTWVMPLMAGDILAIDALLEFALRADQMPDHDLLYADERRVNAATQRIEAFLKPQWSPEFLGSTNYIGRPWAARQSLLERAGLTAETLLAAGHYHMVLASTAHAGKIGHIARVLGERTHDRIESPALEMRALRQAARRAGQKASVRRGRIGGSYRVQREAPSPDLVSIIIPTCAARGLIRTCLDSLRSMTTHSAMEIICIDNISDPASEWKAFLHESAEVVVEIPGAFNWSRFNNIAAREASGKYLLFLNDDIEVIDPDWLTTMLELAARPEIGVVGPQLLFPDRSVQHAGMFLAEGHTARHAFRHIEADDPGYHGLALTQRNVLMVTGACLLVRADVFHAVGGFDEAHAIINNDVDFCLKLHELGLHNVYTPFAQLIHHEQASRAHLHDDCDDAAFTARWQALISAGDPFFHPNLSRASDLYVPEPEPVRALFPGNPLFAAADIKTILAIKVDHIGDFITAFPAFQRVKAAFPQCRLFVLASPAARDLAALEPCIDEVIPFSFFHSRSGLGRLSVSDDDLAALAARLGLLDIDIAIDLRKQPDTRPLLLRTGATWRAGFAESAQFPWLDIALIWDGDERLVGKRSHVADDFVALIESVVAAGQPRPDMIHRGGDWYVRRDAVLEHLALSERHGRRLVSLHPAAGTETKQWPMASFAALADALITTEDVDVVFIGGGDEADIADAIMRRMMRSDHVRSLVGHVGLADLPLLLDACALFVGNDSGPKHIAAALGVPTVGIHSGVVDAREWGPLGSTAVALQRDMVCAPCYAASRADCHRELACLTGIAPSLVLSWCRRLLRAGRVA